MINLKRFFIVLFIELFIIALMVLYGLRVAYVNRNNDKTEVQYVYDSVPAETQNFEITIDEEKLYDTAAFVKKFPNIQKCFTYQGSIYEQMKDTTYLPSIKYILYLDVTFKNITYETQDVDLINYSLFVNDSYHNGINPILLEELNQLSGLSLLPGHSYTVSYAFELSQENIDRERYQNLLRQRFSLMLTGYPNIQHLVLTHITPVEANKDDVAFYQELISSKGVIQTDLPNTKNGTILKIGESYVDNNITLQVDDVSIEHKNIPALIKKIGLDKNVRKGEISDFEKEYMDKNGNAVIRENYYKDAKVVVVHCVIKNDTDAPHSIYLYPYLRNYIGINAVEPAYCHVENLKYKKHGTDYTLDAHSQGSITYLYVIGEFKGKYAKPDFRWDIENKPLYLGFSEMDPGEINLEKEILYGYGKFLRIK